MTMSEIERELRLTANAGYLLAEDAHEPLRRARVQLERHHRQVQSCQPGECGH